MPGNQRILLATFAKNRCHRFRLSWPQGLIPQCFAFAGIFRHSPNYRLLVLMAGMLLGAPVLRSAEPVSPEIIQRYEQILERAPMAGPSFDRVLQSYRSGEGLEALDARWAKLAEQPGDKGTAYAILRGLLADLAGRTDDAERYLTEATKALPDDFHGWLALGDCEIHRGKWAGAVAAYQKGLATMVVGDNRLLLFRKLGQVQ